MLLVSCEFGKNDALQIIQWVEAFFPLESPNTNCFVCFSKGCNFKELQSWFGTDYDAAIRL